MPSSDTATKDPEPRPQPYCCQPPASPTQVVCDTHRVATVAVPACRAPSVRSVPIRPFPNRLTELPPVDGWFGRLGRLSVCRSADIAELNVDRCCPHVVPAPTLGARFPAARTVTLDTLAHLDTSLPVTPTLTRPVTPLSPAPLPSTVTLTLPVRGLFPPTLALPVAASYDRLPLSVDPPTYCVTTAVSDLEIP